AEEQRRAVHMRIELDAVWFDFPDSGKAENLVTAAVGENRQFPVHEPMQPASGANDVESGPDVEVIGVAEDDLRTHFAEFARVERLDAGLRANRHEYGCFDNAVRGGQSSESRLGLRIGFEKFKH